MANLVETIIDRVKVPDKMELAPADRQLLQKLAASVEELKAKKTLTDTQLAEAEERLGAQIQELFEKEKPLLIKAAEPPKPPEIKIDLDDIKRFIAEQSEQGKYQLKSHMQEQYNSASSQLQEIQTAIKDEEVLKKILSLYNQMSGMEMQINRQLRTVKIMTGFTIWTVLLMLAAVVAQVLGYL